MKNKSILITGGTGSFGKNFIKYIYKKHKNLKKLLFSVEMNGNSTNYLMS